MHGPQQRFALGCVLLFLPLGGCVAAPLEMSADAYSPSSCKFVDFHGLEQVPHDRNTPVLCIRGQIEKDREEVWVVPAGEPEALAASGDVLVILPRSSTEVQAKFLDSEAGEPVVLKGTFSFDRECWDKDKAHPAEQTRVCAPVLRPVRLLQGVIFFEGGN